MAGLIKRGKKYYLVYLEGQNEKRVSLRTESYQILLAELTAGI